MNSGSSPSPTHVVLRAFNPTDEACEYAYDRMIAHPFSMDDAAKEAGPSGLQAWATRPNSVLLSVHVDGNDLPSGLLGSINILPGRHAEAQIHIWDRAALGLRNDQHVGLRAMAFGFLSFNLGRLNAFIAEPNTPARRYAERLGFVQEGRARRAFLHSGTLHDGISYGILRDEALQRFEAALAPEPVNLSTVNVEDIVTTGHR